MVGEIRPNGRLEMWSVCHARIKGHIWRRWRVEGVLVVEKIDTIFPLAWGSYIRRNKTMTCILLPDCLNFCPLGTMPVSCPLDLVCLLPCFIQGG